MFEFIVKHKYCDCVRYIKGNDFYHALKQNKLDYKLWEELK